MSDKPFQIRFGISALIVLIAATFLALEYMTVRMAVHQEINQYSVQIIDTNDI